MNVGEVDLLFSKVPDLFGFNIKPILNGYVFIVA